LPNDFRSLASAMDRLCTIAGVEEFAKAAHASGETEYDTSRGLPRILARMRMRGLFRSGARRGGRCTPSQWTPRGKAVSSSLPMSAISMLHFFERAYFGAATFCR